MQRDFRPVAEARPITYGTIADLKMANGRVYRAIFGFKANVCAWWPMGGYRKRAIGTAEPVALSVIKTGDVDHLDWQEAALRQHADPRNLLHVCHSRPRVVS